MAASFIGLAMEHKASIALVVIGLLVARLVQYPVARLFRAAANRRRNCLPPPKFKARDPFLGLDVLRRLRSAVNGRFFLSVLPGLFDEAGSATFELNQAGSPVVWTADPDVVKYILTTGAKDFFVGTSRKEGIDPILGPNIITTEGEYWHETRRVMRPAFARKQFGELETTRKHIDNFMARLPKGGGNVDLKPLFYMLSMDVSTEFLFGMSANNLTSADNSDAAAFAKAFDTVQSTLVKGQWVGKLGYILNLLFPDKVMQDSVALITKNLDKYITRATTNLRAKPQMKGDEARYNILEEMLRAWYTQPKRVHSEALILLIGGRDTTASALSNLFYFLARRADVWDKIREECLAAPEYPSFEDLKALHYVHDCVRESLRLVNPTIDISRTAAVDTIVPRGGGKDGASPMFLPKGSNLNLWLYAMQHRKDIWGPDAEEFRPERWLDYRTTTWAYSPFGGGARLCLGQQLALIEMLYTVFRLAREFRGLRSLDSRPWTESLGIGTTSIFGNEVQLIP
ncbi:cytochrome P450 [Thozetella sp. PMI_491]|nr:cytochrome P450 [Thozetella sp. PMI_491]